MQQNVDNFQKAFNKALDHYETVPMEERDSHFFESAQKLLTISDLNDLIEPFILLSISIYQHTELAATKFKKAIPKNIRQHQYGLLTAVKQNESFFKMFLLEA